MQRSVGFGRGVLFCRWLSPEALGQWEMAFGFLMLAAPVAVLGLPGSFGRYLVRYREAGQLNLFLRRTSAWTFSLAGLAIGALAVEREAFARLVFGDPSQGSLIVLMAGCLATVIFHHFLEAIFAGLRLFRVVSAMHFCQSMIFAVAALSLASLWQASAAAIILGYAAGCLVSSMGVCLWAALRGERIETDAGQLSHREFWPPLVRFAIGVWIANLLSNLFGIIDRYMILHFGGFASSDALEQVGNYHTSCIVPVLLVSVANLLVGATTPHLSHDWERGKRSRVSQRLNRLLQWTAAGMLAAGAGVLWFCPLLFELAFAGKYADGLAVLPWTVATCVWFSLLILAQTYTWCAENTRAASISLAIGLVVNVMLNLLWLPTYGLAGAVAATAVATLLALVVQLGVNFWLGMKVQAITVALAIAPAMIILGRLPATAAAIGMLAIVSLREWQANEALRLRIQSLYDRLRERLKRSASTSLDPAS